MNCSVSRPTAYHPPQHSDPEVLWLHPAYCQAGLPLADTSGAWQRRVDTMAVAIAPLTEGAPVPSGWAFRLLLLYLCDQAVRNASPVVEMGEDAAALVTALGLPVVDPVLREITTQAERLLASKLTVSQEGEAPLGMLDARGQSGRTAPKWRPRLRLNLRFHAGLMQRAVPLERRIVQALAAEPLALDAHGWIRHLLTEQAAGQPATVAWDDLFARFGAAGQEQTAFRAAFEDALRMVYAADPAIALAADDAGVTVGLAAPAPVAAPAPAMPESAPAATGAPLSEGHHGSSPAGVATTDAEAVPSAAASERPQEGQQASTGPSTAPARARGLADPVSLRPPLTGLSGVVWLRRARGDEPPVIGVTPGARMEPERLTLLLLEPLIIPVAGGLPQKELDAISAWAMANRDLIDLVWEGRVDSFEEVSRRVRKVAASGWRQG